jgi:hypothetical protein
MRPQCVRGACFRLARAVSIAVMSDAEQPTEPPPRLAGREWRRLHFVPRQIPRSYVPRTLKGRGRWLFRRAVRWLLPWELIDYPGVYRGASEALGLTVETVRAYTKRSELSGPVALALREAIRVRVEAGQALMAELDAIVARGDQARRRQREAGFMHVDPDTGLSGRVRSGHRRGVKAL